MGMIKNDIDDVVSALVNAEGHSANKVGRRLVLAALDLLGVKDPPDEFVIRFGRKKALGFEFRHSGHKFVAVPEDFDYLEEMISIKRMTDALREAAETFDDYAEHHLAKMPPQEEKAERNVRMATACYEAIGETYVGPSHGPRGEKMPVVSPEERIETMSEWEAEVKGVKDGSLTPVDEVSKARSGNGAPAFAVSPDRAEIVAWINRKATKAGKDGMPETERAMQALADEVAQHVEERPIDLREAFQQIVADVAQRNIKAGWWTDLATGESLNRNFGELVALMHSELSEALEGHRKSKAGALVMDQHLPQHLNVSVELADCIIRIMDSAGNVKMPGDVPLDVVGAFFDKLEYNARRLDHKPEVRKAEGGKAY